MDTSELGPDDKSTMDTIKKRNEEILRVQKTIDRITGQNDKYRNRLETQKEELRRLASQGLENTGIVDLISQMENIELDDKEKMYLLDIFNKMKIEGELTSQNIETVCNTLDKQLAKTWEEFTNKILEYENIKEQLTNSIANMERFDLVKNALNLKILEVQEQYSKDMENLFEEEDALENNPDLNEDVKLLTLESIRKNQTEKEAEYKEDMNCLQEQLKDIAKEIKAARKSVDMLGIDFVGHIEIEKDIAAPMISKSQTEHMEVKQKIDDLQEEICQLQRSRFSCPSAFNFANFNIQSLQTQLQEFKAKQSYLNLRDHLGSKGLTLCPDGMIKTSNGSYLTQKAARDLGLLEGILPHKLEGLLEMIQDDVKEKSEPSDASFSTDEGLDPDDVLYLKQVVGKPLTLALAEVSMKQPRDPIHYLAHWLIKYRYNQEVEVMRAKEAEELTNERNRIEREAIRAMIEDESRKAIMDIIRKAEEIAIERAMARERAATLAAQQAVEEEEEAYELEAKDVLGELI